MAYAKGQYPTGDFLRAVLENDLMQAFGRADETSLKCLKDIAMFVYNEMPINCHGSKEIVKQWTEQMFANQ